VLKFPEIVDDDCVGAARHVAPEKPCRHAGEQRRTPGVGTRAADQGQHAKYEHRAFCVPARPLEEQQPYRPADEADRNWAADCRKPPQGCPAAHEGDSGRRDQDWQYVVELGDVRRMIPPAPRAFHERRRPRRACGGGKRDRDQGHW
jgi:hypothetical protein